MGSQITKIPSICGDSYPGVGFQVDEGDSVRVAMAWPSASAEGWRSLTMEVPKKLSLETDLNGVSVETLLKAAGQLLGDNDFDGFEQLEQMLGDRFPSTVARIFARYSSIDLTHTGSAEACREEIGKFLGGSVPEFSGKHMETAPGKKRAVLVPVGFDPVAIEIGNGQDIRNQVGGSFVNVSGNIPTDALPFSFSTYVNDWSSSVCQPNRAIYATENMEQNGIYSLIDLKPVVADLPISVLYGNIVVTGFNPATGEDVSLTDGEMMDVMNYFQRDSPRDSGREVALIVENHQYGELRETLSHDSPSGTDVADVRDSVESLDDLMEQKVEVAGDSEIGDEMSVSNGER